MAAVVRLEEGLAGAIGDYVDRVQYAFEGQQVTVAKAPFEMIWPASIEPTAVFVTVTLTAAHGGAAHDFGYFPNLASPLTFATMTVPVAAPLPQITTTPPSQPAHVNPVSPAKRNDVSAIWLFTDGLANEGITQREELVRLTGEKVKEMTHPCTIFTFGFGEDHDAQLLKELADAGTGMYYYIAEEAGIAEAFADCLGGLVSVVARTIRLTALPQGGVTLHRTFTTYEHSVTPTEAWITIPDLYSEEERDLLLEVELPAVDPPEPSPAVVVEWHLEYRNVLSGSTEAVSAVALVARPAEVLEGAAHPEVDKHRNRVRCTEAIERCKGLADQRDFQHARQLLDVAMQEVHESISSTDAYCAGLVEDLQDCRRQVESEVQYRSSGGREMMSMASAHQYQRSCGRKQAYVTSAKRAMVQNWYQSPQAAGEDEDEDEDED